MKMINMEEERIKSYATRENLTKAIEKLNLPESVSGVVVPVFIKGTRRFTILFNNITRPEHSQYLAFVAHKGFMVVG